jgi:adenosylcobinamide-phosphate synthase
MSLFIILAAFVWEHGRPQRPDMPRDTAGRWHAWLLENINAGREQHGLLAWALGALLPALAVGLVAAASGQLWQPLAWLFNVVVLYLCLGFRQASFQAASVARALEAGDLDGARSILAEWRPGLLVGFDEGSVARQAVEAVFLQSLIRMFGVLFWFLLLGPTGAVLYLLTRLSRDRWHAEPAFGIFSARIARWLDWLPTRGVAFSFAIIGNFQDALECWRTQAAHWGDQSEGILLAAGAGALGVRLGGDIALPDGKLARPSLGLGEEAGAPVVDNAVALIWRATLLWGAVLGLLWLGSL